MIGGLRSKVSYANVSRLVFTFFSVLFRKTSPAFPEFDFDFMTAMPSRGAFPKSY